MPASCKHLFPLHTKYCSNTAQVTPVGASLYRQSVLFDSNPADVHGEQAHCVLFAICYSGNAVTKPGEREMRVFSKQEQTNKNFQSRTLIIFLLILISGLLSFSLKTVSGQGSVSVSDNLNNFIEGIKIIQRNGTDTETNPGVANPGDRVKLKLTFLEDDDNQLDMDDLHVLRFKLPDTFMCDDGYTTTVDIYFNDSGTMKTIPNNPVVYVPGEGTDPGYLEMRWNYEGLDQQTVTDFKNAGNVEIDIPVIGTVFEIPIDFGDGITILPPSNPGVSKNFEYDKDTQVMTFTVTVDAEDGNVPPEFPIVVSDVMGDAYISFVEGRYIYRHDPFFEEPDDYVHPTIGESTADQGTFSEVPSSFNISHMYRGDTVEFTYKLKVDLNKIEILGQEDESMNNTVRLLGKDEQDNLVPYDLINSRDDSSDDIASVTPIPDVIDMTKTHEVTAGAEGGSAYVDVNWTIISNSRQQISLGGSTITDSLRFDPKNISMAYSQTGGLTVVVKNNNSQVRKTTIPWNQVTTTQTTDELTGEKILTWVWNVPETDKAAYTYEITYTTRSNMRDFKNTDFAYNYVIGRTGEANDQVLITRPGNGKYVGITKENLWTQAQTVKWEVVLRADSVGYDSCYITDTLPGSWINGLLYKDTMQTGSNQGYEITVDPDDLYEGESYEISYIAGNKWTRDAVVVRFFKEDESGVRREGLYPARPEDTTPITVKRSDGSTEERAYREIHLQYVTLNNTERYEMEGLVGDALYHTNRAEVLADTFTYAQAEAYASPVKPTFFKVLGNQQYPTELNKTETYPAWYFRLVFGGVTDNMLKDGKIIIKDQWDLDHPELFELFAKPNNADMNWGSGWNWLFAKLYVSPKPTYPSIADGGMLVWRHGANTVDDFKTKENSVLLPSQEGDGPICKLFATDDGNGHVTFEIENLPKKENGQYWDWYQIICFVVPQGDAAVEELKRLASVEVLEGETPGIQKMTNTAEWVNDLGLELNGSADYQYQNIMMTKEIVSQSGNWVTYRITVNPNGLAINNGEPLTLVDAYSTNQSVDYNSIHVSPEYGSSWDYGGSIKEG